MPFLFKLICSPEGMAYYIDWDNQHLCLRCFFDVDFSVVRDIGLEKADRLQSENTDWKGKFYDYNLWKIYKCNRLYGAQ